MIGQITYMGDTSMVEKFGRRIKSYKELLKFAAEDSKLKDVCNTEATNS
jgi:hypothetical protein